MIISPCRCCCCVFLSVFVVFYYAPAPGGPKRRCASDVFLSVAYIGPKSRTERPRKTKIDTEVAHVTRDWDTTFKVKGSKVNLQGRGHLVAAPAQLVISTNHKVLVSSNSVLRTLMSISAVCIFVITSTKNVVFCLCLSVCLYLRRINLSCRAIS